MVGFDIDHVQRHVLRKLRQKLVNSAHRQQQMAVRAPQSWRRPFLQLPFKHRPRRLRLPLLRQQVRQHRGAPRLAEGTQAIAVFAQHIDDLLRQTRRCSRLKPTVHQTLHARIERPHPQRLQQTRPGNGTVLTRQRNLRQTKLSNPRHPRIIPHGLVDQGCFIIALQFPQQRRIGNGNQRMLIRSGEQPLVERDPDVDGVVGLELSDGTIHGEPTGNPVYRVASFGRMTFRIPLEASSIQGRNNPKGMTLPELSRKIDATGGRGANATYRFHFHRRISLAVSCLSFGPLAIPLGFSLRSRGKSSAVGITVAMFLVYYLFVAAAGAVERRSGPGMIALLWAPNTLGLTLAAWILWRSEHHVTLIPRIFGGNRLRK